MDAVYNEPVPSLAPPRRKRRKIGGRFARKRDIPVFFSTKGPPTSKPFPPSLPLWQSAVKPVPSEARGDSRPSKADESGRKWPRFESGSCVWAFLPSSPPYARNTPLFARAGNLGRGGKKKCRANRQIEQAGRGMCSFPGDRSRKREGEFSLASLLETFEIFQRTPRQTFSRERNAFETHKGDTPTPGKHLSRVLCAPFLRFLFLSFFLFSFFFFSPPVFPLFDPGAEKFKARSRTHASFELFFGKGGYGEGSGGVYFCRISCIFSLSFFKSRLTRSFVQRYSTFCCKCNIVLSFTKN